MEYNKVFPQSLIRVTEKQKRNFRDKTELSSGC